MEEKKWNEAKHPGIPFPERQGNGMGRVEKRMYRRARGQSLLRRLLAVGILAMMALGIAVRQRVNGGLNADYLPNPTATPIAAAYDETVEARQITLEEVSWYAIQTGIYSTQEAAAENCDTYAKRGAPGYVNQDGDKWRVYIACYGDKEEAQTVREKLRGNQEVETFLHTWVCPGISLRLTGAAGQVDVAEAGLSLLGDAAAALRDTAALLDSGERTQAETLAVAQALDEQVRLWRETARARFAKPYPALVDMELSMADSWDAKYAAISKAENATALSAAMKLQAMALFDESCALRETLME